jgi:hypothetical protein
MSIHSRPLNRWMARLALAAILLLAGVPTLGRWMDAGREAPALAATAMCTSEGMAWSAPSSLFGSDPIPAGTQTGEDCAYCPLLASAVPLVLATLLLSPPPAPPPAVDIPVAPASDAGHAHGLGARGPPLFS